MSQSLRAVPGGVVSFGCGSFYLYAYMRLKDCISEVCPLLFDVSSPSVERPVEYIQRIGWDNDPIIVQCLMGNVSCYMRIYDLSTGQYIRVNPSKIKINNTSYLYEFMITMDHDNGIYKAVIMTGYQSLESVVFRKCDIDEFADCSLIRYTHPDNIVPFKAIFDAGDDRKRVFTLAVEGGFKTDGRSLHVSNEFFRTQNQKLIELYSVPYDDMTFTLGDNRGVPFEMGRLLNNILCLGHVEINGERYVRSESSVPEQQVVLEGSPQYIYTVKLERSPYEEEDYADSPNLWFLRDDFVDANGYVLTNEDLSWED